ncbi:MAG TPA: hypothetical protein VGV93_11940 [Acidimicrobiales bacterium]|nr:hypothetical protein [Acidimicrobiales bacterium]
MLFLDEPTTGLDPHSRRELWATIEELVDGGTTLLLTTQYLEEADRLADRIAVIDGGRVIAEGTAAELKARMAATVLELSVHDAEAARQVADVVGPLGASPPVVEGSRIELAVENGAESLIEALRRIDRAGLALTSVALREPASTTSSLP